MPFQFSARLPFGSTGPLPPTETQLAPDEHHTPRRSAAPESLGRGDVWWRHRVPFHVSENASWPRLTKNAPTVTHALRVGQATPSS